MNEMDHSKEDGADSDTKFATLLGWIGYRADGNTVINHEWTASATETHHNDSKPAVSVPNHLLGLTPVFVEPRVEKKAQCQRRIVLRICILAALLIACLTIGFIVLRNSNLMLKKESDFMEQEQITLSGDVHNQTSTEDVEGESSWDYSSDEDEVLDLTDMLMSSNLIRLRGGNTPYEGRVEVKKQGKGWGTICHDWWGSKDGAVACRQLGFGDVDMTMRNAHFGSGSGKIWWNKMNCNGGERSLHSCKKNGNTRNCNHRKDVGVRCQAPDNAPVSPCGSNPCVHGTCSDVNNGARYECRCSTGWTGTRCNNADPCSSSPCLNRGTCRNSGSNYQCTCRTGWTGTRCQTADPCSSSPCLNRGTCRNSGSNYQCTCQTGWTGTRCQTADPCASSPCLNRGTCRNSGSNYQCTCRTGWTGTRCQTVLQPCSSSPCLNGAACRNNGANYQCTCSQGWTGSRCETAIQQPCSSSPCLNGAACRNNGANYECTCSQGWTGSRCETALQQPCSSSPCLNGAACRNTGANYQCTCLQGWTGSRCETALQQPCSSSPCLNGAACRNNGANYQCTCASGWTGSRCETALQQPCSSSPCLNGAACRNNGANYQCTCSQGWTGSRCQTAGVSIPNKTVRLVGGSAFAGRVEVWRNGVWGAICDDHWGMEEANVVCKQLGYTEAVVAYNWQDSKYSQFGDLDGTIWLDDMQCFGTESRIEDCPHDGWGINNCVHDYPFSEQAGVMCYNSALTATNDLLGTGDCGNRPLVNDRIVGGQNVEDAWPWMASLRDSNNNHRCGATLISQNWAVTAAHCDHVAYKLVFGDLKRNTESSTHQESVVTVFRNPNYNENTIDSDFTLLKLRTPVQFDNYVRPICLEVGSREINTYPSGRCMAAGWGDLTYDGERLPNHLKEVNLDLISKSQCSSYYTHITDNMICTDSPRVAGTCQGDSGGPLQCVNNGRWNLVGVTSHGYRCGDVGVPDVFARVSRFWQFVKQTVDMNGGP